MGALMNALTQPWPSQAQPVADLPRKPMPFETGGGAGAASSVYVPRGYGERVPDIPRRPPANQNVSQAEVKANLPPPKSFMDRIWDNYAKRMTPDEFMKSEALWGGARNLAAAKGISESEAFAEIANQIFSRMGANRYLSPDAARKYIGSQRGIASVVPEGGFAVPEKQIGLGDVLPRGAPTRNLDRPIHPGVLEEMRAAGPEKPPTNDHRPIHESTLREMMEAGGQNPLAPPKSPME